MSWLLYRLGRFALARRRAVLIAWLLLAAVTSALALSSGGSTVDDYTVPGQSKEAAALMKERLPAYAGGQTVVVFHATGDQHVTDAAARTAIERSVEELTKTKNVAVVSNPYTSQVVSRDQRTALSSVGWSVPAGNVTDDDLLTLERATDVARQAGLQVEYGGEIYHGARPEVSEVPELVGIAIGFVILLITFGALVTAGLPIVTAIIGVVVSLTALLSIAALTNVASSTVSLALMLGLACGIDYSLFIVSRYRTFLLQGMSIERAVPRAMGTAGSSVVFAAVTVIIALCGLAVANIPFLTVMGSAAAGAVLVALLVAITLLPALLGFAGTSVTRFLTPFVHPQRPELVARTGATEPHRTVGAAWARLVVRFRWPLVVASVALLAVMAIPAFHISLGLPSGKDRPAENTGHKSYELISDAFGPGLNGPLTVVVDTAHADPAGSPTNRIAERLATVDGVAAVAPGPTGPDIAVLQVIPTTGPDSTRTADLVRRIRDDASLTDSTGAEILVGGLTATNIDTSDRLGQALPVFFVVVAALALALLTLAFRAISVPITSIIGFVLSVFAALGAQVAVFEWGWLSGVLGVNPGQTVAFLPIIVLAVVFGLSSDYQVFVVSRIKEEYTRDGNATTAITQGVGASARVVVAAALIMFFVFVAFVATDDPVVKALGFTLAVGVFLDAFVVRLTLVPAIMAIERSRFWYHPKWFARVVPDLDIEGEKLAERLGESTGAHGSDGAGG